MNDAVPNWKCAFTHVFKKVFGGRWLITVGGTYVFVYMSITGMLPAEDVKVFLGMIITFYFTNKIAASTNGQK